VHGRFSLAHFAESLNRGRHAPLIKSNIWLFGVIHFLGQRMTGIAGTTGKA
jgi:hypothetical protein